MLLICVSVFIASNSLTKQKKTETSTFYLSMQQEEKMQLLVDAEKIIINSIFWTDCFYLFSFFFWVPEKNVHTIISHPPEMMCFPFVCLESADYGRSRQLLSLLSIIRPETVVLDFLFFLSLSFSTFILSFSHCKYHDGRFAFNGYYIFLYVCHRN